MKGLPRLIPVMLAMLITSTHSAGADDDPGKCAALQKQFITHELIAPLVGKLLRTPHSVLVAVVESGDELLKGQAAAKKSGAVCRPPRGPQEAMELLMELERRYFVDYMESDSPEEKEAGLRLARQSAQRLAAAVPAKGFKDVPALSAGAIRKLQAILTSKDPAARRTDFANRIAELLNAEFKKDSCSPLQTVFSYSGGGTKLVGDSSALVATGLDVQSMRVVRSVRGKSPEKAFFSISEAARFISVRQALDCDGDRVKETAVSVAPPVMTDPKERFLMIAVPGPSKAESASLDRHLKTLLTAGKLKAGKNWFAARFIAKIEDSGAASGDHPQGRPHQLTVSPAFVDDLSALSRKTSNIKAESLLSEEGRALRAWLAAHPAKTRRSKGPAM